MPDNMRIDNAIETANGILSRQAHHRLNNPMRIAIDELIQTVRDYQELEKAAIIVSTDSSAFVRVADGWLVSTNTLETPATDSLLAAYRAMKQSPSPNDEMESLMDDNLHNEPWKR